jgi:peptide/nickel transport system permease protein
MTDAEQTAPPAPRWRADLQHLGYWRRFLLLAHWHGVNWWLMTSSAIGVLFFICLGLFPGLIAPYRYDEEAGPAKLAPGQLPERWLLVVRRDSGYTDFESLDNGVEKASQAAPVGVRDEVSSRIISEQRAAHGMIGPRPVRAFEETLDAVLTGVVEGKYKATLINEKDKHALDKYSDLTTAGSVGRSYKRGFLMGTNVLGQDVFSRLIYGTRTTLIIGMLSAMFAAVVGIPIGLLSGFWGGWIDRLLTLFMDSLYSFPGLILAIAIAAVLSPGIGNIILAIAVIYIPTYFRIVRGQTMSIKEELYVEAARGLGASRTSILALYIFPNVLSSVVVIFSVNVADAILTGAGLSFIGLGLPETIPDWGVDLARGQEHLRSAWWLVTFPGLAIAMLTLAFSLMGESISEILNPRLNRQ